MIPPEVADLRDILVMMTVTNSETQATKWASEIIERMRGTGYRIESAMFDEATD